MKSRTENVNKNLIFSWDIDESIISNQLSTIESIYFVQKYRFVSISIYFASNK